MDRLEEKSFDSGWYESIFIDTANLLADLESELKRVKNDHAAIRSDLDAVKSWLEGDACKSAAGRKKCVSEIRRRLMTVPRYQGSLE